MKELLIETKRVTYNYRMCFWLLIHLPGGDAGLGERVGWLRAWVCFLLFFQAELSEAAGC